ncbi:MAG: glycosyltransferase family 29 protein [Spirochaetaceae bacterium]|nr:glycosyltransferase family 29 protein [Spirochaetaceae bacterium]
MLKIIKSIIKYILRPFLRPFFARLRRIVCEEIIVANDMLQSNIRDYFMMFNNYKLLDNIDAVKNKIYQSLLNRSFEKLVAGKSIAIVGNGPQQIGKGTGKEIDTHDIVIRFNNFKIAGYENDYGTRTDIWIRNNNVFETKNRQNPEQFKMIVWRFDQGTWENRSELWFLAAAQSLAGEVVYGAIPQRVIDETNMWLCSEGEGVPTLGALVIKFLVSHTDAKSINVYGFSFLEAEEEGIKSCEFHYYDDYYLENLHNIEGERILLRRMLIGERKVK